MTNLFESLFKDRKFPVIFTLFTLLICVTTLLVANTTTFTTSDRIPFYPDDIKVQQPLEHHAPPVLPDTKDHQEHHYAPPVLPDSKDQEPPPKIHEGLLHWEKAFDNNVSVDLNMNWKLCPKSGLMVDYMPCLDNLKAIKALKSRRHMEHRERHCPKSVPRCLLPLPKGYKVKVAWPKSRDMVRLIVW
jgi:hypothetical protein